MAEKKQVEIFTDGACSGNPGPGGWGTILRYKQFERELSGGEANTTNNRMELSAVIAGLKALTEPCCVTLYSDSKYFVDAIQQGWAEKWKAKGWMRTNKDKALNPDLWEQLLALCDGDFVCVSPAHRGALMHYGPSARVRHGNVEFIVVSNRFQVYDDRPFIMTGADMKNYSIVGLKSSNHFRAYFNAHADAVIGADTPSAFPDDVCRLEFKRLLRPIYPLDQDVTYSTT